MSIVGACIITIFRVSESSKNQVDFTFGILLLINLGKPLSNLSAFVIGCACQHCDIYGPRIV